MTDLYKSDIIRTGMSVWIVIYFQRYIISLKEEIILKKIINAVDQVENQMIEGMVKAFPQYVKKLDCGNVVVRAQKKTGKVA